MNEFVDESLWSGKLRSKLIDLWEMRFGHFPKILKVHTPFWILVGKVSKKANY